MRNCAHLANGNKNMDNRIVVNFAPELLLFCDKNRKEKKMQQHQKIFANDGYGKIIGCNRTRQ